MKTALITGGSRGIGAQIVRTLSAAGWRVAFTYCRSEEKALALSAETGALALKCDARDEQQVSHASAQLLKAFRHVDALVHNAGTAWASLLQDMTCTQWDDLFSLHVKGAFLHTRALLPDMISRQTGNIVFITSMWGETGGSMEVGYSACKAALTGMMKALAKEVGPSGIRVNCVSPGVIETDMMNAYSAEDKAALRDETPLGRLGKTEDVAAAVKFLLSDDASFITGQTLSVNGGLVI
ncbi:MAG: SDR family oxidoreductase [Clostridia bacterium]|nr:SDR family oxidoreductase [Clostridia bacterium]